MNESETLIKEKYEKQGYKWLKSGFPDFIFFREDHNKKAIPESVLFCEVKGLNDTIKLNQYKCLELLRSLGLNVNVEMVETINTSTRKYKSYETKEAKKIFSQIKEHLEEGNRTKKIKEIICKEFDISRASFFRYLSKFRINESQNKLKQEIQLGLKR